MPLVRGTKRRSAAEPEPDPYADPESSDASPEPPTRRRRTSPDDDVAYDDDNDNGVGPADNNHAQLVKKMVRLALACEYQRRPIRRADISEKVLGTGAARKFKEVFNAAQIELRSVFGMEMVELPAKEKVTVQQKRAAQKSQSQTSKPTPSWILISTLPSAFRDPAILPPPAAPTSDEEAKYTSLYTLLVSLILLSGGSLSDEKMERYLRRLDILDNVPFGAPASGVEKTEKLLKRMEKEGYVMKIREATVGGEEDVSWLVGPRGKAEVGGGGVEGLVRAVYSHGEMEDADAEELDRRIGRSLGLGGDRSNVNSNGNANGNANANANGGEKKKRGRKRRDEDEDEANDGEEEEGSEDE